MPKLVWTEYNIKDEQSRQIFNENYHNHCKNVQIVTHQDKNAIEAYFMGIAFETTNIAHPTIDDRVIIDPLIHGGISMIEFRCMGTINQINSISNPYPECNTAKYPLLDDYIMWSAIGSNPIQAQFLVDHNELKDKIKYSGTRHNKILDYLKNDSNITILDEGIMDAADLAYTRNQLNQFDSGVKKVVNQFGPIEVWLNIGLPKTVNDLVNSVRNYKAQLFQNISRSI